MSLSAARTETTRPRLEPGYLQTLNTFPPVGWLVREGEGKQKSTRRSCFPSKGGGCVSFGSTHRDTRPRLISETGSLKHSASPDEHQLVDLCVGNIPLRIRDTETGKVDAARLA